MCLQFVGWLFCWQQNTKTTERISTKTWMEDFIQAPLTFGTNPDKGMFFFTFFDLVRKKSGVFIWLVSISEWQKETVWPWRSYELYWGSILVIKWVTCQFLFSAQRGQNHPTREESTDWIQINVAGFFSSLLHWTRHNPSDWSRDPFRGPTSRLGTAGPNCLIACKVVTPASSLHQHSC